MGGAAWVARIMCNATTLTNRCTEVADFGSFEATTHPKTDGLAGQIKALR
jgi:hypothetical protein